MSDTHSRVDVLKSITTKLLKSRKPLVVSSSKNPKVITQLKKLRKTHGILFFENISNLDSITRSAISDDVDFVIGFDVEYNSEENIFMIELYNNAVKSWLVCSTKDERFVQHTDYYLYGPIEELIGAVIRILKDNYKLGVKPTNARIPKER